MKFALSIFVTVLFILDAKSQYSNYYNINSKLTATINENVSGNVNVNKTITNIDYGQLALANAQREKNQLEFQKFQDERERNIALDIAQDPLRAFDYGQLVSIYSKDKKLFSRELLEQYQNSTGFRSFKVEYQLPYLFFTPLYNNHLQNVSKDGVKIDFIINLPVYNKDNKQIDIENNFNSSDTLVGKEIEGKDNNGKLSKIFYHKNSVSRATVYGQSGFRNTLIWEDKYEYYITDNYAMQSSEIGNGYEALFKVRIHGNKDEVNFEKLEGRRYYIRQLVEKIISTAKISELVPLK